jgi:ribonucleotide reductase beta subunit family protein with ferritin-like domain
MEFTFDPKKEYLLDSERNNSYTLYPIKNPDIFALAKKAMSAHWVAEEIDFTKDLDDWEFRLTENERFFIKNVLAFFSSSDGIVNENLAMNFSSEVKVAEARYLYANQIQMEAIHCVKGDTRILTDLGYFEIESLVGKKVNVWNGYQFSNVLIQKTSEASVLFKVKLDNGMYLDCTENHKWHTTEGIVMTKDLKSGIKLINDWGYPILDNENKVEILEYYVPINSSIKVKMDWLRNIYRTGYMITSKNGNFLRDIQLLLTTFNITSTITSTISNYTLKLNDNFDLSRLLYELPKKVTEFKTDIILDGNSVSGTVINGNIHIKPKIETNFISIESITKLDNLHSTFCFNEPVNHTGIFNGIITGQSEVYSLLIDTYIKDPVEKTDLFNALTKNPIVAKKAEWSMKWLDPTKNTFPERLLAFGIVEGIFFSGSFCAIFWLKNRGLMPALTKSNKFISRDESLHCETCVLLYSKLEQKLPESMVHRMFQEAIEIENEFITKSLPVDLLGMNNRKMTQYIKFVADFWLSQLKYSKLYNVANPFSWMESSAIESKVNFFENVSDSYAKAGVGVNEEDNQLMFDLDI